SRCRLVKRSPFLTGCVTHGMAFPAPVTRVIMRKSVRVELPCPLPMKDHGGGLDAGWRDVAVVPAGRGVVVIRGGRYQDDAGISGNEMGFRAADRLHRRHR